MFFNSLHATMLPDTLDNKMFMNYHDYGNPAGLGKNHLLPAATYIKFKNSRSLMHNED